MVKMDSKDRHIIRALQQDGRISNQDLAEKVTVFVRVQLEKHTEEAVKNFETKIARTEHVLECYVMTGRADSLLKVVVADLSDYESFVRRDLHPIGGIASIDTSFAYGVVKKTSVFPKRHKA